ncbi:hypothetical protein J5TS2_42170 [Brevibacillus halotolerans]|uniref:hypothetical protein n=1 Tax=Brevibacillus halotolerans TaxID=1507437 RepID=UPI001B23A310|nr:hypothetical protein [Brevibacillus halotolerans]GIO03549.1 hypothetical protein J5TS2_42170 [Brevibacillus halotolerans]
MDAETRQLEEDRQKYLHDRASLIEGTVAEAQARGEKRMAVQMALELLKLGVDTSIIAKASGMTEAELVALREQN